MNQIVRVINGKKVIFANNLSIHNQLTGREENNCHPINAIEGLEDELNNLQSKVTNLQTNGSTNQDLEEVREEISNIKTKVKNISLDENEGELTFVNYDGDTLRFRSGNEVDNETIRLENKKLSLKKIFTDESLLGEGTNNNPLKLNENSTIINTLNNRITDVGNEVVNLDIELSDIINNAKQDINKNTSDIRSLTKRVKGIGGYLNANNFGKANPDPADLNEYAYEQIFGTIVGHNESEIYDQTKIKNTFDGNIWVFNHYIKDGSIAYEWTNNGTEYINTADNDGVQGLVTGSYEQYEGFIDVLGHITINGLEEFISNTNITLANISDAKMITISAPENAAQGTLSTEQLNLLKSNENSYIKFNDEIFFLQDNRVDKGYMIYSHVSHENTQTYYVKCIAITIGELEQAAWTLTTLALPSPVLPLMASDFLLDEHNGGEIQSFHYDVNSGCVELGTCTKNEVGDLIYSESNPVAIRDDSTTFIEGNLIKWDAVNNRFVDSGISGINNNTTMIRSNIYDDATLEEHLEEIFGYVNVENGGPLMSIGFKVGPNTNISTTAKIIQFNNDDLNTISEGTVTPFTTGDFIQAAVEHIDADKNSIYLRCGINPYSNAIIALKRNGEVGNYTYTATLSNNQISTNILNGTPLLTYYNDIDITTMHLEHLTITYHL